MKNILKKIIPKSIKRKLLNHYDLIFKKKHIKETEYFEIIIPKYNLEAKHLKNLKGIVNRKELLKLLPKNGIVAEIGVDEGHFTKEILEFNSPNKLHLIDVWNTDRYHQGKREQVEITFKNEIEKEKVVLNLGFSTEVVQDFPDGYFDWVYIDTTHCYKNTLQELEMYSVKIKPGGFLAGHDFIIGNWKGLVKYGVIEAVYEFCIKNNWELIYLTFDYREHPSFAIRKII